MTDNSALFNAVRQLLNGRLQGVLATQSLDYPGYPFGSLVPYSIGPDGWPLLLLSHLAKHSRNLEAEQKCNLTIVEQGSGDSQQLMRLSCLGRVQPLSNPTPSSVERHFRYFPGSRKYHDELNFRFHGFQPEHFYFIGGFGAARWIGLEHLKSTNPLDFEQESRLIGELEGSHQAGLLNFMQGQAGTDTPESGLPCHIAGIDNLGMDIRQGEQISRLAFGEACSSTKKIEQAVTGHLE